MVASKHLYCSRSPGVGKTFFGYYYINQARDAGIRFVLYSYESHQTVFFVVDTHTKKAVGPFGSDSLIVIILNNYACNNPELVAWIKDEGNHGSNHVFRKVKTIILASSREDKNMSSLDKCYYKRLYMSLWDMTEKSATLNLPSEMEMFLETCYPDWDKEKFCNVLRNSWSGFAPLFAESLLHESWKRMVARICPKSSVLQTEFRRFW
jgi:hypothetical protein